MWHDLYTKKAGTGWIEVLQSSTRLERRSSSLCVAQLAGGLVQSGGWKRWTAWSGTHADACVGVDGWKDVVPIVWKSGCEDPAIDYSGKRMIAAFSNFFFGVGGWMDGCTSPSRASRKETQVCRLTEFVGQAGIMCIPWFVSPQHRVFMLPSRSTVTHDQRMRTRWMRSTATLVLSAIHMYVFG